MISTVTLPRTSLTTTRLGFGCNALLGPRSRREGVALLAAAFDAGIRHFDVARAYSSGDAEGVLGEFLIGRREQVTVTTKFGLLPPQGALKRLSGLKTLARMLMRFSPGIRKVLGRQSARMVQSGAFSPAQARASLETSLRELKTDRIDLFLLHEANASDCSDELRTFLDGERRAGRIGAFGVGSNFGKVRDILRERPAFAPVLQFESGILAPNRESLPASPPLATITHGAISTSHARLRRHLEQFPATCKNWSEVVGTDLASSETLASLLLAHSSNANPGIVLFSSTRPDAIRRNVDAIAENRFASDQVAHFAECVRAAAGSIR
jgi:D-threo-aldose 1-dehydrogenase